MANRIGKLCLAAAVTIFLVLSCCVCAFGLAPDLSRKCSILFTMNYKDQPLVGGNLRMYRIAVWTEHNGSYDFEWTPELADAGLNLADKGSETFSRHVSMLIESRSLPAMEREFDENGQAAFKNIDCGLYVVYQTQSPKGFEPINAYCISLPILVNGEFAYDLRAKPKPRPEEITTKTQDVTTPGESTTGVTTPGETTPDGHDPDESTTAVHTTDPSDAMTTTTAPSSGLPTETLPQTGQLWWPSWLIGAVGAIMVGLGMTMRVLYRETAEESET